MTPTTAQFATKYGPTGLVTGASDGIGAAIASELAARGFELVLVARRAEKLNELAAQLRETHQVAVDVVPADLGTQSGVERVLESISDKEVGLYVGCAGFGTSGAFLDGQLQDELEMIDVNCRALTALAHPIGQQMRARGRGGMILMGSIVGFQGVAQSANYAATKAYVQSFAEGLAAELRPHGVDVLSSAPGPVHSGFATRAGMKMGAAATPEIVARGTISALGRRVTVRPGAQSKVLGYALATLPRAARSRILGRIMTGMTKHRDAEAQK